MADRRERRTKEQRETVAAIVRTLYEASGADTWSDFAKMAGVHWASLSDWQLAKSVPDGWNLLLMMRAVMQQRADLQVDQLVDSIIPLPAPDSLRRLESLEAAVGTAGPAGVVTLRGLDARVSRIERQLGLEDPAPSQEADGG